MPAIATTLYPVPAYVRIEANWSDVGAATGAAVYRVDCLTGERVPLRPYISFTGDFLDLSCGYSIFWDTESQLDRCVYYCTQAIDAAGNLITRPADYLVTDTFTRTVAVGWGTATSGQVWNAFGGAPGDYSVTGARGKHNVTAISTPLFSTLPMSTANYGVRVTAIPTVLASGGSFESQVWLRSDGTGANGYRAVISYNTTGLLDIFIQQRVAFATTTLATASAFMSYTAASLINIDFQAWGTNLTLKVWDATTPDPVTPSLTATSSTFLTPGSFGLYSIINPGNVNGTIGFLWDNLTVTDPAADPRVVEACSDSLVVPSGGDLYLGDPTRPCNDLVLSLLDTATPDCVPTQGVFFGSIGEDETFEANSGALLPTNSAEPIGVYRTRRSGSGTLNVVTRTFADRDALRRLNKPGSQLLLRSPAKYGVGDRYMLVGAVVEHRMLSDHKIQPRLVTMPHVIPRRARGASQGICGTRVDDLCDTYLTWDAIAAAGLTWADLVRGKASPKTPKPVAPERTWNDVNTQYANWNAVQAGNVDWDDLLDGA